MTDTRRPTTPKPSPHHHLAYSTLDYGYTLGSSGIWGASFILIAASLDHFAPGIVTFVRIGVGAIVLGLFPAARRPVERRDLPAVALVGVVWLAFPMTLYPLAQQRISSGLAGMLGASIPVFTAVISSVVTRRPPAGVHSLGIVVGAAGIVLLGLPAIGNGANSIVGVGLILIACLSYGAAFNIAVPLVQKYGSEPVFWRALVMSVPMTIPFALVGLGDSEFAAGSLLSNVLLGAGGTALAFVLLLNLTARVGATRSSMVTYLEAAFAFVLGTLVRGEPVRVLEVVGCAVLLVGAWLATRSSGLAAERPARDEEFGLGRPAPGGPT